MLPVLKALQRVIDQAVARLPAPPRVEHVEPPAVPITGPSFYASLVLEEIGGNYKPAARNLHQAVRLIGRVNPAHASRILDPSGPWVARLTGYHEKYGYERDFLRGRRDYRDANRKGTRGVYLYFLLPPGIYEVRALESWTKDRRYFVRSADGRAHEIDKGEVDAHLNERGARPSC
jgi:hypothetical protein